MDVVRKYSKELVCKLAYLLGISKEIFKRNYEDWTYTWEDFEGIEDMHIMHNLSVLRNTFIRNHGVLDGDSDATLSNQLNNGMYFDKSVIEYLKERGIDVYRANTSSFDYIKILTDFITQHVPRLKGYFPDWCPFKAISPIFKLNTRNVKKALADYKINYGHYPFQLWVGLDMRNYEYNMLHNDKSLIQCIFRGNDSEIEKYDKWVVYFGKEDEVVYNSEKPAKSAIEPSSSELTQGMQNFIKFVEDADKTLVIVDCENTSLSTVVSVIMQIKPPSKGYKLVLIDDDKSFEDWESVSAFTDIPITRIKSERVLASKSLVDMRLALEVQKEVLVNGVSDVVLISSDSDYCCLVETLEEYKTKFFVVYESDRISKEYLAKLDKLGVVFASSACFDFIDVNSERVNVINARILDKLNNLFSINIDAIFASIKAEGIHIADEELTEFRDKLISKLKISVDDKGDCYLALTK